MGRQPGDRMSRTFIAAGLLFGLGLGGFFDGIVLHQILQWHHMASHVDRFPTTTVEGLRANTLADGLFHAATYVFVVAGLWCLWRFTMSDEYRWSTRAFIGLLLIGFGSFNLVEGTINHHILEIHRVREDSDNAAAWDLAFLAWGAAMLVGGWWLAHQAEHAARS